MNHLSDAEFAKLFRTPPEEAVAAWNKRRAPLVMSKNQLVGSNAGTPQPLAPWAYQDILWNAYSRGFFVARVAQQDVIRCIQSHMDRAIKEGWSFQKFARTLKPELQAKGWWSGTRQDPEGKVMVRNPKTGQDELTRLGTPRRLRTIYETNMAVSYSAGHFKQLKESADLLPWWRYVAIMDKRTRPTHSALHDHVWKHDDPAWGSIWPPNGWNCRCRVEPLTEREAKGTAGYVVQEPAKTVTQVRQVGKDGPSVEVTGVVGKDGRVMFPDAAWAYNPGMANHAIEDLAWSRIKELPEPAQKTFVNSISRDPNLLTQRRQMWEAWSQGVINSEIGHGQSVAVGWLPQNVLTAAQKMGGAWSGASPVVLAVDHDLHHAGRDGKNPLQHVDMEHLRDLPECIANGKFYWHEGRLIVAGPSFPSKKNGRKGVQALIKYVFEAPTAKVPNIHLLTAGEVETSVLGQWRAIR